MKKKAEKAGNRLLNSAFQPKQAPLYFMANVTTHLWTSTAFAITGNISDSPAGAATD